MTTKTSRAAKTETSPKPASKAPTAKAASATTAAPAAKAVKPTVVDAPQAVISGPMMRKKELIEAVVSRSGMKKKDVKPITEALLSVLGEALADNRDLNLPPFGQLKVQRQKDLHNGRMVITKIRQRTPPLKTQEGAVSEAPGTDKT